MDEAVPDPRVLAEEYRFLARLNRWCGTAEVLLAEVEARRGPGATRSLRMVDVGCGGGDVLARIASIGRTRGWTIEAIGIDRSPDSIGTAAAGATSGVSFRNVDLLAATGSFGPAAFEVAHASLVLHHLDDASTVRALRAMADLASELVVWNDLVRDRASEVGAWCSTLGGSRSLRQDAVTSVRRSFTFAEARTVAEAAGLLDVRVRRVRGGRFLLSGRPGPRPLRRPTVRAEGITLDYGGSPVLRDLSFVAHAGEVILVEGPNGVGKSTLLSCLAGALAPSRGRVWRDVTASKVGFHPQDGGLFPALDVAGNLETCATLAGVARGARPAAVRDSLERFGLADHADLAVTRLSGGMRRRLAIAAALVHHPQVAILDEPDAGLDAEGRVALVRAIAESTGRGGTVVLSSHEPGWISGGVAAATRMELGR